MRRPNYYKLVGRETVPVRNVLEWARYYDGAMNDRRRVDLTYLDTDVHVSTVFMGLDHNFTGQGPPILFETMIFGSELDQSMRRYSTWDEAAAGHIALVEQLRKVLADSPSRAVFNRILRAGISSKV
jgi:hypothetical protein